MLNEIKAVIYLYLKTSIMKNSPLAKNGADFGITCGTIATQQKIICYQ